MDVLEIQTALRNQGFNTGELDDIWGRRTVQAVKAFQRAHGLKDDAVVDLRALAGATGAVVSGPQNGVSSPLVWYEEAKQLIGTTEGPRSANNPVILKWARDLKIDYRGDDIPWCGLFVAHCIGSTLPDEQLPAGPLLARNWRKFGESCQPMRGAVLVFWRGKKEGVQGHVGFYHSEDRKAFHVLGGNQSDQVNLTRIGKNRLLAARWPRSAAILTGTVVEAEGEGPLSHDEA